MYQGAIASSRTEASRLARLGRVDKISRAQGLTRRLLDGREYRRNVPHAIVTSRKHAAERNRLADSARTRSSAFHPEEPPLAQARCRRLRPRWSSRLRTPALSATASCRCYCYSMVQFVQCATTWIGLTEVSTLLAESETGCIVAVRWPDSPLSDTVMLPGP